MFEVSNMILVGALGRNVGKTEFACALIKELSKKYKVSGVKVTTIHPNDYDFHGDIPGYELFLQGKKAFEIKEEPQKNAASDGSDTAKMLYHGAKKSFWVCTSFKELPAAAEGIAALAKKFEVVVCESNSLRHYLKPKQFILLEKQGTASTKPDAETIRAYADVLLDQFDKLTIEKIVGNLNF